MLVTRLLAPLRFLAVRQLLPGCGCLREVPSLVFAHVSLLAHSGAGGWPSHPRCDASSFCPAAPSAGITALAVTCNDLECVGCSMALIVRTEKWRQWHPVGGGGGGGWGPRGLGLKAIWPLCDPSPPAPSGCPIVHEGIEIDLVLNYEIYREHCH